MSVMVNENIFNALKMAYINENNSINKKEILIKINKKKNFVGDRYILNSIDNEIFVKILEEGYIKKR